VQIPVFFSLYKVLFVTIEMRTRRSYGWIKESVGAGSDHLFNLLRSVSFSTRRRSGVRPLPRIGVWPIIRWASRCGSDELNPTPPESDPEMIFDWMPLIFHLHARGLPGAW